MPVLAAFLRAINVGGTGKLPMKDLVALCEAAGLASVRTYIASGNVVFATALDAAEVEARLGRALLAYMGKPVGLALRTAEELEAVLALNPFTAHDAKGRDHHVPPGTRPRQTCSTRSCGPTANSWRSASREVYVHYPAGMGTSTLKLPFAKVGTARNQGTVRAVLALLREVEAAAPTTSKATAKAKRPTAKTTAKESAAKTPAKATTAKVPRAAASTTTPRARRPR
jgi:uncharacterized protein (DUF1697 family)